MHIFGRPDTPFCDKSRKKRGVVWDSGTEGNCGKRSQRDDDFLLKDGFFGVEHLFKLCSYFHIPCPVSSSFLLWYHVENSIKLPPTFATYRQTMFQEANSSDPGGWLTSQLWVAKGDTKSSSKGRLDSAPMDFTQMYGVQIPPSTRAKQPTGHGPWRAERRTPVRSKTLVDVRLALERT